MNHNCNNNKETINLNLHGLCKQNQKWSIFGFYFQEIFSISIDK